MLADRMKTMPTGYRGGAEPGDGVTSRCGGGWGWWGRLVLMLVELLVVVGMAILTLMFAMVL